MFCEFGANPHILQQICCFGSKWPFVVDPTWAMRSFVPTIPSTHAHHSPTNVIRVFAEYGVRLDVIWMIREKKSSILNSW